MRRIVVNDKEYYYRIGSSNIVIKREAESHIVDFSIFTGWSWDAIERGEHKRYFKITPKQIADYIERENI